jgi:hypothetical protein
MIHFLKKLSVRVSFSLAQDQPDNKIPAVSYSQHAPSVSMVDPINSGMIKISLKKVGSQLYDPPLMVEIFVTEGSLPLR